MNVIENFIADSLGEIWLVGKILVIGSVLLGCSSDDEFVSLKGEITELRKDISEMKEEPVEPKPEKRWYLVSDRKSITRDEVTMERVFEITGGQFEIMWGVSTDPKWDISRAVITVYRKNGTIVARLTETDEPEIGVQPLNAGPGSYYLKITYVGILYILIREYR